MKIRKILENRFVKKVLPYLLSRVIRFINSTIRLKIINEEIYLELKKKNKKLIYTIWHNRLFYIPYYFRNQDIHILVSESRDGNYLSNTLKQLKFYPIEGSSTRGGLKAAVRMIRMLKKGFDGGIAPDGPQGPKYYLKRGVIDIAQKTGHTILPVTYGVSKKWQLSAWDNFIIPFPFAKGVLVYGQPFEVSKDISSDQIEEVRLEIEQELCRITELADEQD
ncbi:MAG: lysophospholipid acyltransferase family protein [bacterium]|nr:lysophospholipid acyltransferase family protein [bacterium]